MIDVESYLKAGWATVGPILAGEALEAFRDAYDDVYRRAAGPARNVSLATADDGTPLANLQAHYMHHASEAIAEFVLGPQVAEVFSTVLGTPEVRLEFEQGFWKPAGHGGPTDWHDDNAYFTVEPPEGGCGLWIALDDATVDNGCMWVVPGSHRETGRTHRRDEATDHLLRTEVDDAAAVAVELPAGHGMVFAFTMLHTTKRNTSQGDRRAFALHAVRADVRHRDPMWDARDESFRPWLGVRGAGRPA